VSLLGTPVSAVAEIIYKVTNDLPDQNGWSIDGTITLSGTGTYQTRDEVNGAEQAYAFEFTNGNPSDTWQIDPALMWTGFNWLDNNGGTLEATSSTLTLSSGSFLQFLADAGRNFRWQNNYFDTTIYQAGDDNRFWGSSTFSPTTSGGDWIIGSVAAVPEIDPAGMGSVLALVSGALAVLERRRLKVA